MSSLAKYENHGLPGGSYDHVKVVSGSPSTIVCCWLQVSIREEVVYLVDVSVLYAGTSVIYLPTSGPDLSNCLACIFVHKRIIKSDASITSIH